jgi:hypothetical protein
MANRLPALAIAAFFMTSLTPLTNVASAMPFDVYAIKNAAPTDIDAVRYYGRGGWGWGVGAGIVGGAIIGSMLAAPYYYGPGPYYAPAPYYGPGPYYGSGDAVGYCMRRFRSYDVRSGTYVGYDGLRHPCP